MKPTICPFLGLKDDPETHQAFPSLRNCCQRARPIEPVSLEHQSTHCLSLNYVRCAVLANSEIIPLPVDFQVMEPSRKRYYIGAVISVVLIMILIVVGWRQSWFLAQSSAPTPMKTDLYSGTVVIPTPISTSRIAIPSVLTNTQKISTLSPNLTPSSPVPSPTATPTPDAYPTIIVENTQTTIPLATETICAPPSGWVTYVVQPNDSLFNLGLKFGVTVADLQEANCMGASVVIYAGQRLYVPNVPTRIPPVSPTRIPTESASPTTPEPVSTETPFPTDTPQPTNTTNPTNTLTPPPLPTDTFPTDTLTPPPTEAGQR
jgi:LysM repeat protein